MISSFLLTIVFFSIHFNWVMYITSLNTLISSVSLNCHLCACDTQPVFSFLPIWPRFYNHSLSKRSTTNVFLHDCKSFNSQLFKQNFFSLDSNNLPKCVPTHPLSITMLAILVLFSMNMYLLCPNHSILVFVNLTVLCLDLKTTTTIATSTVHFELLRLALLKSTKFSNNFRLQHIQNSLGHWSCCFQSP